MLNQSTFHIIDIPTNARLMRKRDELVKAIPVQRVHGVSIGQAREAPQGMFNGTFPHGGHDSPARPYFL